MSGPNDEADTPNGRENQEAGRESYENEDGTTDWTEYENTFGYQAIEEMRDQAETDPTLAEYLSETTHDNKFYPDND